MVFETIPYGWYWWLERSYVCVCEEDCGVAWHNVNDAVCVRPGTAPQSFPPLKPSRPSSKRYRHHENDIFRLRDENILSIIDDGRNHV